MNLNLKIETRTHTCPNHNNVEYQVVKDQADNSIYDSDLALNMQTEITKINFWEDTFKPIRTATNLLHIRASKSYSSGYLSEKDNKYTYCMQDQLFKKDCNKNCKAQHIDSSEVDAYLAKIGSISSEILDRARTYNASALGDCRLPKKLEIKTPPVLERKVKTVQPETKIKEKNMSGVIWNSFNLDGKGDFLPIENNNAIKSIKEYPVEQSSTEDHIQALPPSFSYPNLKQ